VLDKSDMVHYSNIGWLTNLITENKIVRGSGNQTMSRRSNTLERRTQIVQGLSATMSEHGYGGATMHSIAQRAGLTTGLLHYHFKSKQEILLALVDSLHAIIEDRYQKRLSEQVNGGNAFDQLRAFIDAHLAHGDDADEEAVACWVVIGSEAVRDETVRGAYQSVVSKQISTLENILEACLIESGKSTASKRSLALGTYAAIEGSYGLIVAAPNLIETGFAAPTVLSMTMGAITAQPSTETRNVPL